MNTLGHSNPDIAWLLRTQDPEDLCKDLDRVETALKDVFNLPMGLGSIPYKNIALRRSHDIIKYLRFAHDIDSGE